MAENSFVVRALHAMIPIRAPRTAVGGAAAAFLGAAILIALAQPEWLLPLLALASLLGMALLVFLHPIAAAFAWLVFAGTTPEMWLGDLIGDGGDGTTIVGLIKLAGLGIAALSMLRYGMRGDPANPAFAYTAIFVIGLVHGLHPALTPLESLRSLAGSAAPYAFAFARLPRRWADAIIRTTCWLPLITVFGDTPLALAGIRPLFRELDGLRLAGLSHPAFLGGIALAGAYACLVELLRSGRKSDLALLGINGLILLLSGARAPLTLGVAVGACAFLMLPSERFPFRRRLPILLGIATALPLVAALAGQLTAIRLFNLLDNEADGLSGRDLIWPYFETAWDGSPWVGWGLGAAKVVIDPNSEIAKLLGTTTAHNEYLRVGVDGGWLGLTLLSLTLLLWCMRHTAHMRRTDRVIIRLVFVAFAVHSFTDSTLISSTASVLFTWVCAVFARAEAETQRLAVPARPRSRPVPRMREA